MTTLPTLCNYGKTRVNANFGSLEKTRTKMFLNGICDKKNGHDDSDEITSEILNPLPTYLASALI